MQLFSRGIEELNYQVNAHLITMTQFEVNASILIPFKKFARPFGSGFPSARYLHAVSHALTRAISTRLFSLFAFSAFCRTVSASSAPIARGRGISPRNGYKIGG